MTETFKELLCEALGEDRWVTEERIIETIRELMEAK